ALGVHRETIGVEKTFLGGDASVQLRLPFIQNDAGSGVSESEVGDLTAVLKYAFVNEPDRVLTGGPAVTRPPSDIPTVLIVHPDHVDEVHPTLIQPFVGYLWSI